MRLHRNVGTLLTVTGTVATDQTGSTYRVVPANDDPVYDPSQGFQVYFSFTQSGGATSPTAKVKLQTSLDKSVWVDVVESTQLSADGSKAETKDATAAVTPILTYVRAVTVLGGGTKPNHTADVRLLSDAPFKLVLVS